MNIELKGTYLKDVFAKFDANKNKSLEFEEFVQMMDHIHYRPELEPYFNKYKNNVTGLIHS